MLVHLAHHWPDAHDHDLWPFALDYAIWINNHTPHRELGMAPVEVFTQTRIGCQYIQRARVFGCPTFVLDPRIQDRRKIPKWNPRSVQGQFLGFSSEHSTTVGLVRNLNTGSVTPQYHVVHDEMFHTVPISNNDVKHHEAWPKMFLEHRQHYLFGDLNDGAVIHPTDMPPELANEWLLSDTPHETSELQREYTHEDADDNVDVNDTEEQEWEAPEDRMLTQSPASNQSSIQSPTKLPTKFPTETKTTRSGRTIRPPKADAYDEDNWITAISTTDTRLAPIGIYCTRQPTTTKHRLDP
jgi:hypothetical protein